jgi:roadblock/LC7 domain-containing protein
MSGGRQPGAATPQETTMAKLDDLLKIDGVMAAGEFTADGTLVDYRANMNMPPEMAAMSAQFCATVSMMFNALAAAFSHLTPMQFTPQQGWAYSGGDMTVAVGGRVGVFIETEKADFNKLFQVLAGETAVSRS